MGKKLVVTSIVAVAVFSVAMPVHASLSMSASGAPIVGGSFDQHFTVSSTGGTFDKLEIFVVMGAPLGDFAPNLSGDTIHAFSVAGWSEASATDTSAVATGAATIVNTFALHFDGTPTDGIVREIAMFASSGGSYLNPLNGFGSPVALEIKYNGLGVWAEEQFGDLTLQQAQALAGGGAVPTPSAALLASLGVLLSSRMGRRRNRA